MEDNEQPWGGWHHLVQQVGWGSGSGWVWSGSGWVRFWVCMGDGLGLDGWGSGSGWVGNWSGWVGDLWAQAQAFSLVG